MQIPLLIFYFLTPALLLWAEKRFRIVDWLGAVFFCYVIGMLVGNVLKSNSLPADYQSFTQLADTLKGLCVVVALPLVLFATDIKAWRAAAPKAIFSYFLGVVAVFITTFIAAFCFKNYLPNVDEISGLAVAVYVGGTVNMAAVATSLGISQATFVQTNLADMAVCSAYLALLMTVFHRFLLLILPKYQPQYIPQPTDFEEEIPKVKGINFEKIKSIIISILLAVVVLGIMLGISQLIYHKTDDMTLILGVSILGLVFSLVKKIRDLPYSNDVGQYLLLSFCLVIGSLTDFDALFTYSWHIYAFITCCVFGSIGVHILLAYLFKIDADTMLITSTAGIFGPPFIPPVAKVMRNPEILFSGMATAIIGIAIGTVAGIAAVKWVHLMLM